MQKILSLSLFVTMIIGSIVFSSCSKEEKEDTPPVSGDKVTFNADIAPIINTKCDPCHVGTAASEVKIYQYNKAKEQINNILLTTNLDPSNTGFMPEGETKLSQAELDLIAKWKSDGLLEK